jgi:hypothetical protein
VFITIKQQIKLYWVTTRDHAEDWFIFAGSDLQARAYHEHYEGYGKGDARARLIVSDVTLKEFMNGTPPCHARFEDLHQIGIEAGTIPGRRKGRFNGEIFRNGITRGHHRAGTAAAGTGERLRAGGMLILLNSDVQGGSGTAASELGQLGTSAEDCGGLAG